MRVKTSTPRKTGSPVLRTSVKIIASATLLFYAILSMYPYVTLLSGAFKSSTEVLTNPWPFTKHPTTKAFVDVWQALDFPSLVANSLILVVLSCGLILIIFPLAGYAFATLDFPLKKILFSVFVGAMFVPGVTVLLPVVILDEKLHLLGTPWAVVLPVVNGAAPIAIILLRSYYSSIPYELYEAAVLDGCNTFGIFRRVYFPLSRSALVTVTIINFVGTWNEYVLPRLTNNDPKKFPLPVGLQSLLSTSIVQWNQVMAVSLLIVMPVIVLFIFLQRFFINGIQGSVKG
jgi:multiple sugar transport system permease protein